MGLRWHEVFQEEIKVVSACRGETSDVTKEKLVGLAISGGGIRSATFGLGVLEGLKKHGLLPKLDYLSTVSGGGYIGAWLTANCRRAAESKRISWLDPRADWNLSIDHLRRYSNYLSPTLGFFSADTWSMAAIWVRNTILVQLTVMLAITVALLIPRPLQLAFRHWPEVGNWRWATVFLFVLSAVGIAGNHFRFAFKTGVSFLEARRWHRGLAGAGVLLGSAILVGNAFHFDPFSRNEQNIPLSCVMALLLIGGGFCLQPVAVKVVNVLWRGPDKPEKINYTQAWVQALVVIPMMAVGFLVGAIMWGESLPGDGALSKLSTFSEFFEGAWHFWPFPLGVVFVSLWLFSICSIRSYKDWRCWGAAITAPLPAMLVLHGLLSAIMLFLHNWATKGEQGQWMAYIWAPAMVLYALSVSIVILIGMLGRQSCEAVREWWSRCGAWLGIYGFGWMLISIAVVYGPLLSAWLFQAGTWGASISGGWIATTLAGLLAGNSSATGKNPTISTRRKVLDVIARIAPFVFIAGLLVALSTVLHLLIANASGLVWKNAAQLQHDHWTLMGKANHRIEGYLLAGCFAALLVFAARVDINEFSLNAFYRNRLIRCYLGATRFRKGEQRQPQNFTGFDENDDLTLASQLTAVPAGPFHIINCALNLGGSKDLALHSRHSANFTLTPMACGSSYGSSDMVSSDLSSGAASNENPVVVEEVGYLPTETYGGEKAQPTLGQAIAVSGAAASPNMGYHTSTPVAFLLTLFNVRLGWWFPNPKVSYLKNSSPWFSLRYMFMELFGGANDKSSYLAISDGGHFENLAAYELVRRKCKVIIISDGECDSDLSFEGLGTLIRMCDVDFGAKIHLDVNAIRRGDSIWSNRRSAVGHIDYADKTRGTLIYLKASMTGHEDTAILQYKASHPAFPHESTGNQFYAENQFESYRSLGRDIAMRLFEAVANEKNFDTMIYKLEKICSPTLYEANQVSEHSKYLVDLWSKLREDPDLHSLDREFTAAWPDASGDFRDAFYLCSEMLKLMENVFVELRLEENWDHPENAGWRAMFQRWSSSPSLQKTWSLISETHSLRFQYFCDRRLGLPVRVQAATGGR